MDGLIDLHTELQADIPQIQVEVDLEAAQRYGIKPGDVRRAAATLVSGIEVGDIFNNGRAYDVNVWSTPETRASVTDIEELPIDIPGGGTVQLAELADVRIAPTPNTIRHEGLLRRIQVEANLEPGRISPPPSSRSKPRSLDIEFPLEYHPEMVGEFQERQAAQDRLLNLGLVAALGIFLLLQASFGSTRLAISRS